MKYKRPHPGRRPRWAPLVAVCFAVVGLAIPLPATALPSLSLFGGQLYYTGGDITVDVIYNETAFDEILQLRSALGVLDVVDGSQVGTQVTVTAEQLAGLGIGVGDELQFGLHVLDTNRDYYLGPGERNADGLDHAYVRFLRKYVYVGFEDLLNGGDRDFDDTVFRISGGTTTEPTAGPMTTDVAIAEPSPLLLLLSGISLLGLGRRKK